MMLEASCQKAPAGPDTHNALQRLTTPQNTCCWQINLSDHLASKAPLKLAYLTDINDTKGKAKKDGGMLQDFDAMPERRCMTT